MPIQQASYRGVRFDVVSVDDNLERATITHAYPFVNGGDIEDLGLNPLTIFTMKRILWIMSQSV